MENNTRLSEQLELWNYRARKNGLKTVMCSNFTPEQCIAADASQKNVLHNLLKGRSFQCCLEIGSGYGRLTPLLFKYCKKVIATDLSFVMLNKIAPDSKFDISRIVCDTVRLPFVNERFDLVFISCVLGHIKDERDFNSALVELAQSTKDKGVLLIDEMTGIDNSLVAYGHYRVRTPLRIVQGLPEFDRKIAYHYDFGPQPHCAILLQKHYSF